MTGGMDMGKKRFVFDVSARASRARYRNSEVLESLRGYARKVGWRRFTPREYQAWDGPRVGVVTVIKRFGSWREALLRLGIGGVRAREYEAEELIAGLERAWKALKRPPGPEEVRKRTGFSHNAYKRRWGSMARACSLVAEHHAGRLTRKELLRGVAGRAQRKTIPVDVRWRVMKRDRYRCVLCGRNPAKDAGVELHLDHVVPVSRGGTNEEGNLRTLCRECNQGRSDERPRGGGKM